MSKDHVRATKSHAEVILGKHPSHPVTMRVEILRADGYPWLKLDHATVTQINGKGLLISGNEWNPNPKLTRQAWWCEPVPSGKTDNEDDLAWRLMSQLGPVIGQPVCGSAEILF